MDLGEKIKNARQNKGLTQSQLATKIGLSAQRISQYESNYRRPRPELLARIAEELNVPIFYFRDDEYLDSADAFLFKERVGQYFNAANVEPADLSDSDMRGWERIFDERYRPTKKDVQDFSESTGVSVDYLLGLFDDEVYPPLLKEYCCSISVDGFSEVDIALIISHLLKFFQEDIKIANFTAADAEVVAEILLKYIKIENIIPLAWTIAESSAEIQEAAIAVLYAGKKTSNRMRGRWAKIEPVICENGEEMYAVYEYCGEKLEKTRTRVFHTVDAAKEYIRLNNKKIAHDNMDDSD